MEVSVSFMTQLFKGESDLLLQVLPPAASDCSGGQAAKVLCHFFQLPVGGGKNGGACLCHESAGESAKGFPIFQSKRWIIHA
jgi:hypothetical protein